MIRASERAARDVLVGARGIAALMRGETSESAMAAAVLIADGLKNLRLVGGFIEGMGKAQKKGGRRHGH